MKQLMEGLEGFQHLKEVHKYVMVNCSACMGSPGTGHPACPRCRGEGVIFTTTDKSNPKDPCADARCPLRKRLS